MRAWRWVIGMLVMGFAQPALAVAEDFILSDILVQQLKQSKFLMDLLGTAKDTTALARDTATFARESVQVAKNINTLIHDPGMFMGMTAASMYSAFPELHETLANTYSVRESLDYINNPQWLPDYDPYAFYKQFNAVANATMSSFDVSARAIDFWGISERHDQQFEVLRSQQQAAYDHLNHLAGMINSTGVSPLMMQVETAKATAISASAQAQAAATLDRLLMTTQLQFMHSAGAQALAHGRWLEQETHTAHSSTGDWLLSPLKHRKP